MIYRLFGILLGCSLLHCQGATWRPLPGELRYDEACYLTAHNAHAAKEHGYVYAQQNLSIKKQLEHGVRGLKFGTYIEHDDVILSHKGPRLTRLLRRGKQQMPLSDALCTIKQFLDEHPHEVLTLFIETYVRRTDEEVDGPFKQAGLDRYILRPRDWNTLSHRWPTYAWMREHNKRLIIFNSLGTTGLCFNQWEHLVENRWGRTHPVKARKERPQSRAYACYPRSLYLLNFFPMVQLNIDNPYERINTCMLDTFLSQVLSQGLHSGSNKHLLPTFLCIDYVDIGDGLHQVMKINSFWIERKSLARSH